METYDYKQVMKEDVKDYISEHYPNGLNKEFSCISKCKETLEDKMWIADSVTGNASGSYTFSTWTAEENICHNNDLLNEALEEFGYDGVPKDKGAEWCDVTIRCYLLSQIVDEVVDELWNEDDEEEQEEDNEG